MRADITVDASGRNTAFPDWLRAEGIAVSEEESPAGILYFTRHYRLRDGAEEPPRDGTPGAGDLGYIKFGVFTADNRHFSVTLAMPEIETELRMAVDEAGSVRSHLRRDPGCARWTDPARAEPASQVFSMGNLKSMWRSLRCRQPQVLNFFALGDAAVRTNPLYGRGCSAGVVHAHILRDVLDATSDPAARAVKFDAETRKALRPFYDSMVRQDAHGHPPRGKRARSALQAVAPRARDEEPDRGCDRACDARRHHGTPTRRPVKSTGSCGQWPV